MKKTVRSFYKAAAALLIAAVFIGSTPYTASAFERDMAYYKLRQFEATGVMDTSDPLSWMQGRVPYTPDRYLKAGQSGDLVGSGGCSYFAAAYMLLKMGQLDIRNGEDPITVLDKMEAIKGWLTWGKMDFTRINEAYPEVTCEGYKKRFPTSDFHKQVQLIREMMDQGYFIIVCLDGPHSNGHYIFIDEVLDDDDMVIGDSAYEGTNWNDTHLMAGAYLLDYSLFRCGDLKPAACPSIYKYNLQEYNDPARDGWDHFADDEENAWAIETRTDEAGEKTGSGSSGKSSGKSSDKTSGKPAKDETISLDNGHKLVIQDNVEKD